MLSMISLKYFERTSFKLCSDSIKAKSVSYFVDKTLKLSWNICFIIRKKLKSILSTQNFAFRSFLLQKLS